MNPIATCRNLSKSFSGNPVVVDLSLDVNPGEMIALSLPSGEGKTTLLNILSGLTLPDAGSVEIDGVSLIRASEHERSQLRQGTTSIMHQSNFLFPWLSVDDNVAMNEEDPLIRDWLSDVRIRLGIGDFSSTPAARLSGGQRRRVCFFRSIQSNPRLLLLDEPTTGLDDTLAEEVRSVIRELTAGGAACVVSTHDHATSMSSDRLITSLKNGATP